MTAQGEPDDFEVARDVFEKLRHLQRERQERVLRWVTEGLGVANPANAASTQSATLAAAAAAAAANSDALSAAATPAGGTDIKSFVDAKKPRSDQQFVATVAYYYRFEAPPAQRKDTVDTKAIQDAARLVQRKRLTDPHSTLNNAKNAGYLDSKARGEFAINTVGENLVVMTLPGKGGSTKSTKKAPKKAARKSARKTKKR